MTKVDAGNVDAVAAAVATTLCRYDTAIDTSPQDAARRASVWMTSELAARQQVATTGAGAWWNDLARAKGYTTTRVVKDPEPTPSLGAGREGRRLYVTATPVPAQRGAAVPEAQTFAISMLLTRGPHGWRVAQLSKQQQPPRP